MSKLFLKRAFGILLLLSVLLLLISCDLISRYITVQNDEPADDDDFSNEKNENEIIGDSFLITEFHFSYFENNTPFVKLKADNLHDALYTYEHGAKARFTVLECTVIEDYYDVFDVGTEISLLLNMNWKQQSDGNVKTLTVEEMDDIINSFDYVYLYSYSNPGNLFYEDSLYELENGESKTFENLLYYPIEMQSHRFIPVKNGVVDFVSLDTACSKYDVRLVNRNSMINYEDYFWQEMSEEELISSIEQLRAISMTAQ